MFLCSSFELLRLLRGGLPRGTSQRVIPLLTLFSGVISDLSKLVLFRWFLPSFSPRAMVVTVVADLKYLWEEKGVHEPAQDMLKDLGVTTMSRFSLWAESRAAMKQILKDEMSLDPSVGYNRLKIITVVDAWETGCVRVKESPPGIRVRHRRRPAARSPPHHRSPPHRSGRAAAWPSATGNTARQTPGAAAWRG